MSDQLILALILIHHNTIIVCLPLLRMLQLMSLRLRFPSEAEDLSLKDLRTCCSTSLWKDALVSLIKASLFKSLSFEGA